jgi:PAS domain S-box-containing protein
MPAAGSERRKSGIPIVGDLAWGTHFCLFYETRADLLDILVPYFRAGLLANELCIWVVAPPLSAQAARRALRKAVPDFNALDNAGRMLIVASDRWPVDEAASEAMIVAKVDESLYGGFEGLRFASNAFPEGTGGTPTAHYGAEAISRYNAIAAFGYPRNRFDASELIEMVKNHRFALIRNGDRWELLESTEAHLVKDALRRSEEKLRSIFRNMSEAFAYHRIVLNDEGKPIDYVFLEVNPAFERLTGLRARDIIGKRVTEVLPGIENDPAGWIDKYGAVALSGKPMRFESYCEPLGRWYALSAYSPYKGYFSVTFSDVTATKESIEHLATANQELSAMNQALLEETQERIRIEETLRESQSRLSKAQEISHLGSWELDLGKDELYWSDEVYKIFGLEPAEFKPTYEAFLGAVHPADRRAVDAAFTASLRQGRDSYEIEHRIVRKSSGEIRYVHEKCEHIRDRDGQIVRSVGMVQDITDRKLREIETQTQAEFLRLVNESRGTRELLEKAASFFQEQSGCQAVGIRLRLAGDYPFAVAYGFPERFLRQENQLRACDDQGLPLLDATGDPVLDCMCGTVIRGRFSPEKPFFTQRGSFWTNSLRDLLAGGEASPFTLTRSACSQEGYESVALIHLGFGDEQLGAVQFSDRRKNLFSPEEISIWESLADYLAVALAKFRAEDALLLEGDKLRAVIDNVNVGIGITDPGGTTLSLNAAALPMHGLGADAEMPMDLDAYVEGFELRYPDGRLMRFEEWPTARAIRGEHVRDYEVILVNRSKRQSRFISYSVVPIYDANGQVVLHVFNMVDLTEHKRAERELRRLNRTLKALSQSGQATVRAESEASYLAEVCRIITEACGHSMVWIGYKEADAGKTVKPVAQCGFDAGYVDTVNITWADTERGRGPTGTAIRTVTPVVCRNILTDPAFLPWRQEALARGYASSIALPLAAGGEVFGVVNIYSEKPDPFSEEEIRLLEELAGDISHGVMMLRLRAKNIEAEKVLRRDKETLERLIAERSRELVSAQMELEKAKRLSDVGALAATVAHELRNPLATINMAVHNIMRKTDGARFAGHLARISKKVRESDQIIDNLLFYSRIRAPHYEDVDINPLIKECVESARRVSASGKRISFRKKLHPTRHVLIQADPLQMAEVFNNILNNACDALPESGGVVEILTDSDEQSVRITFTDNGVGMDARDLQRIFDPFFTTKARGTGLGLTVCYQIVNLHDGTIEVESQPGKGTQVRVTLPRKERIRSGEP